MWLPGVGKRQRRVSRPVQSSWGWHSSSSPGLAPYTSLWCKQLSHEDRSHQGQRSTPGSLAPSHGPRPPDLTRGHRQGAPKAQVRGEKDPDQPHWLIFKPEMFCLDGASQNIGLHHIKLYQDQTLSAWALAVPNSLSTPGIFHDPKNDPARLAGQGLSS
jgi:hypothetical protein